MKVHFICRGNVLRSLVAETYLKSLNVKNVDCISSGVNVDLNDPVERGYFQNTLSLLARHGISNYAKRVSDQLTQQRVAYADVTVCVNQRAFDEASSVVRLPKNTIVWDVVDIGEGQRAVNKDIPKNRMRYEEEIYSEIITQVNELIDGFKSS